MAVRLAPGVDQAIKIATAKIGELARTAGFLTPGLRGACGRDLVVSIGHRLFHLGMNTLAEGRNPVGSARDLGWRFFVKLDNKIVAAIEVRRAGDGGYRPGPLSEGPLVRGTARAIHEAEVLLKHDSLDYEPMLLVAPALHVSALLLRADDPEFSRILPVPPISRPFRPFHPLAVRAFETDLVIIARQARDKTADLLAVEG
jgi:hypothetical protein